YWVRHVRAAVRFADGVRSLEAQDVNTFLEVGPDAVLSAMAQDCLTERSERSTGGPVTVPVLRKDRPETQALTAAVTELHIHGVTVDWERVFSGRGARRVDLPTYAFQRQRFWLDSSAAIGDVGSVGLGPVWHPLLGAVVSLAGGGGVLLSGRLSLATHAWLADHAVHGVALVPGTAFVEMAVQAGDQVGCG
ncbi:polyketide synthase dehydratase domain-containing protein, partial [Streptomyces albiflaviniger]|nr:polyketide synthase dehydratase domain-containing protein [Streptomyces albiflaviniger]